MNESDVISIENIQKRYGSFHAVGNLTLNLREGEFFSLLGPSGCGKTTALRMIAGFVEPSEGSIRIDGESMEGIPANKRPTNMVFQNYAIFPHLSVGDNVAYGLRFRGVGKSEIENRVNEVLEMVALGGFDQRRVTELSGGQRQRVALARALILKPRVLLLDEPLSALDKKLREQMQFELRRLQQNLGITFVMVTHDQYEAMTMSDRIGVMFEGNLIQVDEPAILYALPCNKQVASFIGEMNFLPAELENQSNGKLGVISPCLGGSKIEINENKNVRERGKSITLGIRPEQLDIAKSQQNDYDVTIEGLVKEVAFYGEIVHYHVKIDGLDQPIAVSVPNYYLKVDHKPDDKVWLGIGADSLIDLGTQ